MSRTLSLGLVLLLAPALRACAYGKRFSGKSEGKVSLGFAAGTSSQARRLSTLEPFSPRTLPSSPMFL